VAAALDLTQLPPGMQLGGYRLEGRLGQGGMGTVYRAVQISIGRTVAVKILHADRVARPDRLEAFLNEARLAAKLHHHGLVTVHDVGHLPQLGVVFYVMDCIHGRTLHMKVAQEGPQPPAAARAITLAIADAIGHAHRAGLIHRDLKPENVLLDQQGRVVVTDLGLATEGVQRPGPSSARTLHIIGSPGWTAPEQLRNPAWVVPASDVFAIGCLHYFLLTGQPPFTGETLIDLAVAVCAELPRRWEDALPPAELDLLDLLMAKHPDDRPADGAAVVALLKQPAGAQSSTTSRVHRRLRRRR
jgi:eukaryotic-like serine/threonine-protein kinase